MIKNLTALLSHENSRIFVSLRRNEEHFAEAYINILINELTGTRRIITFSESKKMARMYIRSYVLHQV